MSVLYVYVIISNSSDETKYERSTSETSRLSSTALMLYDESKILPHLKPNRNFTIGSEEFVIKQNWTSHGVAAVVWDSVSSSFYCYHQRTDICRHKYKWTAENIV